MRKLAHYLKQERRRAGLSQEDVAWLLGAAARQHINRYEHGRHLPPLRAALGYEAIFRKPVAQIFAGTFAAVARVIARRAKERRRHLTRLKDSPKTLRRHWSLEAIVDAHEG